MGQSEILEVLEKYKKPMSRQEIAQELNIRDIHVSNLINRLIKNRSIKIIEIDRIEALSKYKCKRRMRLYYI